jgi:hypothetical protein
MHVSRRRPCRGGIREYGAVSVQLNPAGGEVKGGGVVDSRRGASEKLEASIRFCNLVWMPESGAAACRLRGRIRTLIATGVHLVIRVYLVKGVVFMAMASKDV